MAQLFESVGAPKSLLSDNGTNLTSGAFEKFLDKYKVKPLFTPFRSQAFRDYENILSKLSSELECMKQKNNHSLSTAEVAVARSPLPLSFQGGEETARHVKELTA